MSTLAWKTTRCIHNSIFDAKIRHYVEVWHLKCNPFWYKHICGYDATVEWKSENLSAKRAINFMVQLCASERTLVGIVLEDALKIAQETGFQDTEESFRFAIARSWLEYHTHKGLQYVVIAPKLAEVLW